MISDLKIINDDVNDYIKLKIENIVNEVVNLIFYPKF